jgi:hypothetical protein
MALRALRRVFAMPKEREKGERDAARKVSFVKLGNDLNTRAG